MEKVSKAERVMDQMVAKHTLTPDGRDWLVTALDPFHDLDHPLAGYPDADTSRTLVSSYQYAVDISKDPALPVGNWDAHVFTLPFVQSALGYSAMHKGAIPASGAYIDSDLTLHDRGLVNILQVAPGAPLFPQTVAQYATTYSTMIPVSTTIFNGSASRVVAMAIEVVDTTADMYKQGALTAYRLPQMPSMGNSIIKDTNGAGRLFPVPYKSYCSPPATVASALSLIGSRQWAMADGGYAVLTQSSVINPLSTPQNICPFMASNGHKNTVGEIGTMTVIGSSVLPSASVSTPSETVTCPFNTSGFMLTGLNANSTFRVKFKMVVETAPQHWQSDLVVLASPSAPYDPTTLEAYSKILTMVPVAVPVNDNAFGDWFAGIVRVLSKIALPISAALTPVLPIAGPIGMAISETSKAITRVVDSSKKEDKLRANPSSNALRVRGKQPSRRAK